MLIKIEPKFRYGFLSLTFAQISQTKSDLRQKRIWKEIMVTNSEKQPAIWRFAEAPRGTKRHWISKSRDLEAVVELLPLLLAQGFVYGDLIFNTATAQVSNMRPIMKTGDLIFYPTRGALDDYLTPRGRKHTNSELETTIFAFLRPLFEICSRDQIWINPQIAHAAIRDYLRHKLEIFQNRSHAAIQRVRHPLEGHRLAWPPENRKKSLAFLIISPPLWENGPQLLNVFAMSSFVNLIWCHRLRKGLWRDLGVSLHHPRFLVAEVDARTNILGGPYNLDPHKSNDTPRRWLDFPESISSFSAEWPIEVILNVDLGPQKP